MAVFLDPTLLTRATIATLGYGQGIMDALRVEQLTQQWHADLESWAIPQEILDQAESVPWAHPVSMFTVDAEIEDSLSHQKAREAMPQTGSVLDIGCGGGRASLALTPPAGTAIGVDHEQEMLDEFASAGVRRGVVHHEFLGHWPAVADYVPECDVVVCHHVVYNVADIAPFLQALNDHALRRIVIELPMHHPVSDMSELWRKFWNLERPKKPTARDLHEIARAMGFDAQIEVWTDEKCGGRNELSHADRVRFARIRLCLPADREPEVEQALADAGPNPPRELATIWWDRK